MTWTEQMSKIVNSLKLWPTQNLKQQQKNNENEQTKLVLPFTNRSDPKLWVSGFSRKYWTIWSPQTVFPQVIQELELRGSSPCRWGRCSLLITVPLLHHPPLQACSSSFLPAYLIIRLVRWILEHP